jgi:hypothetical protein
MATDLGTVVLMHNNKKVLEQDITLIRLMEKHNLLFELEEKQSLSTDPVGSLFFAKLVRASSEYTQKDKSCTSEYVGSSFTKLVRTSSEYAQTLRRPANRHRRVLSVIDTSELKTH